MKAVVFGLGRMGICIAYGMHHLGYKVHCVDRLPNEYKLKGLVPGGKFTLIEKNSEIKKLLSKEKPDIVISSMPYHQLWPVAKACIDLNIRYCDLGGRVDVSKKINDYGLSKNCRPIFTDLGLAPGWVNIVGESMVKYPFENPDKVELMVGGLPAKQMHNDNTAFDGVNGWNPLNYIITWSIDGLINEYRDDCLILKHGETKTVKGMSGLLKVKSVLGDLEAFYTSGGASHTLESMKNKGVKNCAYRTLRYPGHRDLVRWLINDAQLSDEALADIFSKGCNLPDEKDLVIVKVDIYKGEKSLSFEKVVNADDRFSAMQKSTAFSICSVAAEMGKGVYDDRVLENRSGNKSLSNVLGYSDVNYECFNNNLNELLNK